MTLSDAQKVRLLYSAARTPVSERAQSSSVEWESVFSALQENQRLTLDVGPQDLIWYPERLRLWSDLLRGNSSKIRQFLCENDGWSLLVADADLPDREALFVIRPLTFPSLDEALLWVSGAQWEHFSMRVQSLGTDCRVAVFSFGSFLT